jgi:hypothetical protein
MKLDSTCERLEIEQSNELCTTTANLYFRCVHNQRSILRIPLVSAHARQLTVSD